MKRYMFNFNVKDTLVLALLYLLCGLALCFFQGSILTTVVRIIGIVLIAYGAYMLYVYFGVQQLRRYSSYVFRRSVFDSRSDHGVLAAYDHQLHPDHRRRSARDQLDCSDSVFARLKKLWRFELGILPGCCPLPSRLLAFSSSSNPDPSSIRL